MTDKRLDSQAFAGSELLDELRGEEENELNLRALAVVSGISDDALLRRLVDLGIDGGTIAAMSLLPLAQVAWADGEVQAEERSAILKAAENAGIHSDSPSHRLLEGWLDQPPVAAIGGAWRDYIAVVAGRLDDEDRDKLKEQVIGRARAVAASAGGFLGMAKISAEEKAVLDELATAFDGS